MICAGIDAGSRTLKVLLSTHLAGPRSRPPLLTRGWSRMRWRCNYSIGC